jgi:hypothetical protein
LKPFREVASRFNQRRAAFFVFALPVLLNTRSARYEIFFAQVTTTNAAAHKRAARWRRLKARPAFAQATAA